MSTTPPLILPKLTSEEAETVALLIHELAGQDRLGETDTTVTWQKLIDYCTAHRISQKAVELRLRKAGYPPATARDIAKTVALPDSLRKHYKE